MQTIKVNKKFTHVEFLLIKFKKNLIKPSSQIVSENKKLF